MELSSVIVNAAICSEHSWYNRGQDRLKKSLSDVGSRSDMMFLNYEEVLLHSVYEDKIFAIKQAASIGYEKILWLDCSITAIKPLDEIWDHINRFGYYLYQSGSNCAVTCNDHSLNCYGVTRDRAELFYECATNVVGINLKSNVGKAFYDLWVKSLDDGSNIGLKWPTEIQRKQESKDPRFKYHRQDQSTASLAAGLLGLEIDSGKFVSRYEANNIQDSTIFVLRGGDY